MRLILQQSKKGGGTLRSKLPEHSFYKVQDNIC